jgi:hypothetical protein
MANSPAFSYAHVIETDVPAAAIWALYDDVSTWPQWDAQAEAVTRDGPFEAGTTGTMKFAGQDPLAYRLIRVEPLREFVDETPVGDMVLRVSHRLEPAGTGRLRLTYTAEIDGPAEQAGQLGPMITADFPETMAALIALARRNSGEPHAD